MTHADYLAWARAMWGNTSPAVAFLARIRLVRIKNYYGLARYLNYLHAITGDSSDE